MKVAELQQFLGNIVPFARAAGASQKVVTELSRVLHCLDPFKEQNLTDFNDFLKKADEYHRTGKLTAPTLNGKSRTRAARTPALSVEAAAALFTDLQEHATDPALSYEEITTRLSAIESLTIPCLKQLAAKVGVTLSEKTKKEIVKQFERRITELKASYDRGQQYRFGEPA